MDLEWASYINMGKDVSQIVKTISESIKVLKDVRSNSKPEAAKLIDATVEALREQVSELQQKQFDLQNMAFALSQENLKLAQTYRETLDELTTFKKFDVARDLYERVLLALNTTAYREKSFQGPADEQPLLCPNCFDNSKKTYLSFHEHAMHTKHLKCNVCGTNAHVTRNDGPAVRIGSVNRSPRGVLDDW